MLLDDAEYGALYGILNGDKTFKDKPKNQDSSLRQRVYKKWKSGQYELKEFHGPMAENTPQRIVHTNTGSIVIKKSELLLIVHVTMTKVKLSKTLWHIGTAVYRKILFRNY